MTDKDQPPAPHDRTTDAAPASRAGPGSGASASQGLRGGLAGQRVVLVGLMGAGKTTVGRRLASAAGMRFLDSDTEVEQAAGCSISEIFERFGEAYFRDGERRVIERLLDEGPLVLATGGGAFVHPKTRALIRSKAISVWLRADLDLLVKRVSRRDTRPLLRQGKPKEIMERLMAERYPLYGEADIVVETGDGPHDHVVRKIMTALDRHLALKDRTAAEPVAP